MSFKDILERYKNNTATEEENKIVEEELEKYQEITDYYTDLDHFQPVIEELPPERSEELVKVRRAVKKRITLVILSSVCITCVLVFLFIQGFHYIVKPYLNEHVYYNPETYTYTKYNSDLNLELAALAELYFPGVLVNYVTTENTGIGKYNITIQHSTLNGLNNEYEYGTIDKNHIKINDGFFQYAPMNAFTYGTKFSNIGWDDSNALKTETMGRISKLPDSAYAQVTLSFDRDLSMEEISDLVKAHPNLIFCWVGIRNSEWDRQLLPLIGFNANGTGIVYEGLNKSYPYFELGGLNEEQLSADALSKHFKSLLQFEIDHQELLGSVSSELNQMSNEGYYKEVLDYVNQNGVQSYGVVVQGYPADILALCREEYICKILGDHVELLLY